MKNLTLTNTKQTSIISQHLFINTVRINHQDDNGIGYSIIRVMPDVFQAQ